MNKHGSGLRIAVLAFVVGMSALGGVAIEPAAASCEPEGHPNQVDWNTGGSELSEAKILREPNNLTLQSGEERWYKILVDEEGGAIVPDTWCVGTGTSVSIFKMEGDDRTEVGTWTYDGSSYTSELPVLPSGMYYIRINSGTLYTESFYHLSFDVAEANPTDFKLGTIETYPDQPHGAGEVTFVTSVKKNESLSGYNSTSERYGPFTDEATVSLVVNGRTVDSKQITLDAGGSTPIDFTYQFTADDSGSNSVEIRISPSWTKSFTSGSTTIEVQISDLDSDGLTDSRENEVGTEVSDPDTDDDGINDRSEIHNDTDPIRRDTDSDGLSDGREADIDTNMTYGDTDEDGLDDSAEIEQGTEPTKNDTDSDGIMDGRENEIGVDPTSNDTDADGLADREEVQQGTDPARLDTDDDGLSDKKELELNTDPENTDSDGDSVSDFDEFKQGTDPLDNSHAATQEVENESQIVSDRALRVDSKKVNVLLKSQKTVITPDEPAVISFSATALISAQDTVKIQLILETPSGVSITGTDFVESGNGQYTSTISLDPGESKGIRIKANANEIGRFGITGKMVYYIGDDKANATMQQVTIPVEVVGQLSTSPPTQRSTSSHSTQKDTPRSASAGTPGFGVAYSILALLLFTLIVRRRPS